MGRKGKELMESVGFIGLGTIARAIVTGLCTAPAARLRSPLLISPRNAIKSALLTSQFPDKVSVARSNQEICDSCDTIFLCVLPAQAEQVLRSLDFNKHQTLISCVATLSSETIASAAAPLKSSNVFRAVPLPPVAVHAGVTLLAPPGGHAGRQIFDLLVGYLEVSSDEQLAALQAVTTLMGPHYELLNATQKWAVEQGVPEELASDYIARTFLSISHDAMDNRNRADGFSKLVAEQTPGGLNQRAIAGLEAAGVYSAYKRALEKSNDLLLGRQ